jgi:hypothetical protein
MAVTKIRRISSWTMIAITCITLVILALFYFGGVGEPINGEKNPIYTGELLIWTYCLLGLCVVSLLLFGLVQFGGKFIMEPKAAIVSLSIFVGFAILLIIAYLLSDGALLTSHINIDSQKYNTEFWLRITDMWLYATYILAFLAVCAMIWGSVKKILTK